MKKQLKSLAPVVLLVGLGLVTSGCGLLSPAPAPTSNDSGGWDGGGLFDGGGFDGIGDGLFGGFGN